MAQSSLDEGRVSHSVGRNPLKALRLLARTLTIVFLVLGFLALAEVFLYQNDVPFPIDPGNGLNVAFVYFLVIAGGLGLLLAGWRYPALRLNFWQGLYIVLGAGLASWLNLQYVSYQYICCMYGYEIGYGYPIGSIWYVFVTDTRLSWNQVYAMIQHHSPLITRVISWPATLANSIFFLNACLLLTIALRLMASRVLYWMRTQKS